MRLERSLLSSTIISMRSSLISFLMIALITFFICVDSSRDSMRPLSRWTVSK